MPVIVGPLRAVPAGSPRVFDPKVVDGAVNGIAQARPRLGEWSRRLQSGAMCRPMR